MTVTNSETPKPNGAARAMRSDRLLGATMIVAGLAIAIVSYAQTGNAHQVVAQAPQSPANTAPPRDPTEGQQRPTTPAPEPARPQPMPDATPNTPGTTGSSTTTPTPPAALPPAPAEKVGEPIKAR